MGDDAWNELTSAELDDLRRMAGFMVPASTSYGVPGADDPVIFADILRSLGRDRSEVRKALALLSELAGGDFAGLDPAAAETIAMSLLAQNRREIIALGRAVLQCYYRDTRVIRSLGLEPGSPFPRGNTVEPSNWSLLNAVRQRPPMWRDTEES